MASNVPINFSIPNENIISSYSWTDLINGHGYIDFYPCEIGGDTLLVTNSNYMNESNYIFGSSSSNTTLYEKTFTTTFGINRTLEGDAIISCPWGVYSGAGSSAKVTATIYINDTQIATDNTTLTWSSNYDATGSYISTIVTIPLTKIAAGDSFKVKIKFETLTNNGAEATWISPYPRENKYEATTWTMNLTKVICSIPFKLDL